MFENPYHGFVELNKSGQYSFVIFEHDDEYMRMSGFDDEESAEDHLQIELNELNYLYQLRVSKDHE